LKIVTILPGFIRDNGNSRRRDEKNGRRIVRNGEREEKTPENPRICSPEEKIARWTKKLAA
jgi:hypothetical protein